MKLRLYKVGWSNEGIGYRRAGYFILKPNEDSVYWRLRKVHGVKGKQELEYEYDFGTEIEAFKAGNLAVKANRRIVGRVRI